MIYLIFVLGAIVGSFLNVCIYRLPRGESLLFPPSRCPACQKRLIMLDLIPLLSFILMRGHCRYCRAPISWRYPLVELLTASLFCLAWLNQQDSLFFFLFQIGWLSCLLVLFFIDLENQVIPDSVSIFGVTVGLVYHLLDLRIFDSISGGLIGFIFLWLCGKLGKLLFKKAALGEGDYFVGAVLGSGLGWLSGLLAIFLAYLLAALVALLLLLRKKTRFGEYLPFAPFLAVGGIMALFFGRQILAWWLGLS